MNQGFFDSIDFVATKKYESLIPKCGSCGLHKTCQSPKMPYSGEGKRKVLLVGEAPGYNEDIQGKQFVGQTGDLLKEKLKNIGVNMREDCWLTNSLICHPPRNKIENKKAVEYCRPNLIRTIDELKPDVIILLGSKAVESLITYLWKEDPGGIYKWIGWNIPNQKINAWICPTYHPSYILRNEKRDSVLLHKILQDNLQKAFELEGKPWKNTPEYKSMVYPIFEEDKAVNEIQKMMNLNQPLSFDYETTTLKPDSDHSHIVCCSLSTRDKAISFPWSKGTKGIMGKFLLSDILKIGHNIKFEERWTIKEFGHGVNNWTWDTIIAAHILDNRKGVTNLKFQSFVHLGAESYDDHIKPYIFAKGGNIHNRIKEIPMDKLLLYCGLDSLYEHKVAEIQMEKMGHVGK